MVMQTDLSFDPSLLAMLHKYWSGQALSPVEQDLLDRWLAAAPENLSFLKEIDSQEALVAAFRNWKQADTEAIWQRSYLPLQREQTPARRITRRWWPAAAAVLLLALGAGWWYTRQELAPAPIVSASTDVDPGRYGAVLTLADGSEMLLDTVRNGLLTTQDGARLVINEGRLSYQSADAEETVAYNRMTTPRGRQFQLQLPDGSRVWLNAASSIRYPTVFSGNNRTVEITGEVYIEVAGDSRRSFSVQIGDSMQVQLTGGHVNINAYTDEPVLKTTLLEGLVNVRTAQQEMPLQPGQQAQISPEGGRVVSNADLQEAVAWKNGRFYFQHADLPTVMRQLARWYDVEVVYEGNIPEASFTGKIDQSLTLSQLLKGLGNTINYSIENKKIIIRP
ncbi:MAG: DUF4974 domain-containing protein [Candidatus Pseudobacter hemicellulosilyticus]|uniref:DUF4974 domain-containing protein n=1 Tax=Candidatus Pseudobacter hemicellulosilyticus TaxID=3121375 RepID=A0AAJ5WY70_9BACT|nr:MAG: DUF4974 domain-containing protein [Pseudobacter sp.]